MQYTIFNDRLKITADTLGGELISVVCDGKERLWQNERGTWNRRAPLLFPIAGNCDMWVEGKKYPMPAHGFAMNKQFTLKEQGGSYLLFTLSSDEETKKAYPFDFLLDMQYTIEGNVLTVTQTVKNPAATDMYFSLGGHESYALDKPISAYELDFEKEEEFVHLVHNKKGRLSGEKKYFGKGRKFILPASYLINGKTVIFGDLRSKKVLLKERVGGKKPIVRLTFDGFSNLLLWRCAGGRYLCIEPWLNLPDDVHGGTEFSQKAGVVKLGGGEEKTFVRTMEYL